MSDEYIINLYFDKPLTDTQVDEIENRLNTAYFTDEIKEEHCYLEDQQTQEEEKQGIVPTLEQYIQRSLETAKTDGFARQVGLEVNTDKTEVDAFFTGWDCCRSTVKAEAKRIMREFNQ